MQTRLIRVVGFEVFLSRSWEGCRDKEYHRVEVSLGVFPTEGEAQLVRDSAIAPSSLQFADQVAACSACGSAAPTEEAPFAFQRRRYDTPSGRTEPGSLYFAEWYPCRDVSGKCVIHGWSNCDGRHLLCVLPNGHVWDIDGRASNCTMPDDTTHRCWVRHGDPEKGEPVHVDKNGHTCAAGAGSIAVPNWHGFLHNGELRSC